MARLRTAENDSHYAPWRSARSHPSSEVYWLNLYRTGMGRVTCPLLMALSVHSPMTVMFIPPPCSVNLEYPKLLPYITWLLRINLPNYVIFFNDRSGFEEFPWLGNVLRCCKGYHVDIRLHNTIVVELIYRLCNLFALQNWFRNLIISAVTVWLSVRARLNWRGISLHFSWFDCLQKGVGPSSARGRNWPPPYTSLSALQAQTWGVSGRVSP